MTRGPHWEQAPDRDQKPELNLFGTDPLSEDAEPTLDTVIVGGRIPVGERFEEAAIGIRDGRIAAIGSDAALDRHARARIDARGLWILPGAIDGHTHMEAPAFGAQSADSFESGTAAAAAGGVTSIIDFTLGTPEIPLGRQIDLRRQQATDAMVDVALHAEIVTSEQARLEEIRSAVRAGVSSFKHYMIYGERVDHGALLKSFRAIAAAGATAMVHAEDQEVVEAATKQLRRCLPQGMMSLPRSRPTASEAVAVSVLVCLAELTGAHVHVAHVSTAAAVNLIAAAKRRGVAISAETCPHYLLLDEEVYKSENGRQFSVVPPLRTAADNAALWDALSCGAIDTVVTDHCPFPRSAKDRPPDPLQAPCGLPGVETMLSLVFSFGVRTSRISLSRFVSCVSSRPAQLFGLSPTKGSLQIGADADLTLFDPHAAWVIEAGALHMNVDFSPFEGWKLVGKTRSTLVRGRPVFRDGEVLAAPGWGRFTPRHTNRDVPKKETP
ncbi:amidohydrolase family protein [Candidatus Bipolaricaulota bacterium]|nr:amidohydrolase family protein [Candidatus Bipolaricaulota bacterium]